MKCYDCGHGYRPILGVLKMDNPVIGEYDVESVEHFECLNCGKKLFPKDTLEAIERIKNDKLNALLLNEPIKNFIDATEASQILGMSKQAFNKHQKIKNGFIFSVKLSGKKFYHTESVLLFQKNGDGRFSLNLNNN